MEEKKGPLSGIISDAISSMDLSGDSQKAVNVASDSNSLMDERLRNAQKADGFVDLSEGNDFDSNFINNERNGEGSERIGDSGLNSEQVRIDESEKRGSPVDRGDEIRNEIDRVGSGSIKGEEIIGNDNINNDKGQVGMSESESEIGEGFNNINNDDISGGVGMGDNGNEDKEREQLNDQVGDFNGLINDKRGALNPGVSSGSSSNLGNGNIDHIKWFSEISNKDIMFVGGKGASLGEMFNNKFPVPPGFVITAQSFGSFINKSGIGNKIKEIIEKVDFENTSELTNASKQIRGLIEEQEITEDLRKEIIEAYHILSTDEIDEQGISEDALNILKNAQEPAFVSVRSSATTEDLADASFAGQQESFLNVKGNDSLVEHVKKCFSSLYTPRAIYYRNKKGFSEGEALLAVVVQKMINSEKSGVVFSKDPVNLNENVAIEAVFGLGEGIVSGKIKPDHYVVSNELKIEDVRIANKKIAVVRTGSGDNEIVKLSAEKSKSQVLTSGEIVDIADYAIKLEKHYNKPQDIEFAIEGGEIYIIQSRPITTLGGKKEAGELKGNVILDGQSASPGVGSGVVKIINSMDDLPKIKKGDILVTEMTNPDMVVAMQKSAAIVTDEGGMTSHAAIVSREMGIPCIVGTETATQVLKDGMRITVDGSSGRVFEGEVAESKAVEIKEAIKTSKIKIKVIVDLPDFASRAAETGLDDVGLTRLEGIIASMKKHPLKYEKEGKLEEYSKVIEDGLSKILEHFKSIWFRASDIRTDEYASLEGAPEKEINPMLGFHGVRFSLKHPEILRAELDAMKKVASSNPEKKIGIMFPQVITIEEVKEARKYFDEIKESNMEFGVMVETPASVQIIDSICEYVDFISFGTNDLTQYTLAVDRNNEDVQYLYNELDPAIFSQIEKVIDACNSKDVETSICGQAGSKKEMAEFLFKKGIKSISVNADAAYDISKLVKGLEEGFVKEEDERIKSEEIERARIEEEERMKVEEQRRFKENRRKLDEERRKFDDERKKHEEIKKRFEEEREKAKQEREKEINEKVDEKIINSDLKKEERGEQEVGRVRESGFEKDRDERPGGKKRKMNQKKYERFKKWKERKRQRWLERKKKEDENINNDKSNQGSEMSSRDGEVERRQITSNNKKIEGEKGEVRREDEIETSESGEEIGVSQEQGWGKKAELGFSSDEDKSIDNKDEWVEEFNTGQKQDSKSGFLNKDKIEFGAEREGIDTEELQETPGPIEPFDNLDRIEDKAEDIQEEIKKDSEEKVDEIQDSVEVEKDFTYKNEEEMKKEIDENFDAISSRNVNDSKFSDEIGEKKSEESSEVEEERVVEEVEPEVEKVSSSDIEETGSEPDSFEDIGVYNPDEDSSQDDKQKYNYNFDDD